MYHPCDGLAEILKCQINRAVALLLNSGDIQNLVVKKVENGVVAGKDLNNPQAVYFVSIDKIERIITYPD
ncbi:hypothetical protein LC087_06835 [Bacillus carboniphilus]|uniref:Uncharacterized protein n=1 Tax=Bacillus carboniphilus TaxID=86663 RepID=A0ABY9JPL7_9BACI|nr:hypothetical protein [Bacillus carboniphilus]WLR41321.1 hypothetical protein LC087_10320 [Bacillus carboniphilus]WLR43831.1 hypothetical protein LC087_06835 [Bacillus carboniphilus]